MKKSVFTFAAAILMVLAAASVLLLFLDKEQIDARRLLGKAAAEAEPEEDILNTEAAPEGEIPLKQEKIPSKAKCGYIRLRLHEPETVS